jgi:hypothetical protein
MKFGPGWLHPFEQSLFRLRFELGGEELSNLTQWEAREAQANHRASTVAEHVFRNSKRLIGVVLWFEAERPRESGMVFLQALGFETANPMETWDGMPPWLEKDPAEDYPPCHWAAFDLTQDRSQLCILIKTAISEEAHAISYIVDPDAEIVLHVYDDRGMDLTGLSRESIGEAYGVFSDWLLDYDRERMAAALEA